VEVKSYQDLIAWQKGLALVTYVYEVTSSFPRDEMYGLTTQMRRAAVSIPSNIAEGHGRATKGEFLQFLCHARGSLCELQTQLFIARQLGYLASERQQAALSTSDELGRVLNGLIAAIERGRLKGAGATNR